MIKRFFLYFLWMFIVMIGVGQNKTIPSSYCISPMEYKLYKMINEYRSRYDLPPVPLSGSLSYVASQHVKDLVANHPDQGSCNSHSWSDKGNWKPFCYPRDENKKNSVWDKPMELTSYRGKGYEIIYWENSEVIIDSIMMMWKSVDYFNSFLMNAGKWSGKKWNAIGIGIYQNYACAWFGEARDPIGKPRICGEVETNPEQEPFTEKEKLIETPKMELISDPGDTDEQKPVAENKVLPVKTGVYYIIVKSQQSKDIMNRAVEEARKKGYAEARLVNGDKLRLSVMDFRQKASADSALRAVKKNYRDAWILVK